MGICIDDGDIFNSHDVVSLFTNTPIEKCLDIIKERLKNDKTLKDRTKLNTEDIIELLQFILTTTYFSFRGQIFRQIFGAAIGSPVSAIVANLFMEWLEKEAIMTAPLDCKPKYWRRYVDDVLEIIQKDTTLKLTEHLNTIDPTGSIKFTHEEEDQGKIPFLDTLIVRKEDGSVKMLVYRKKTHTDQYLNFKSQYPLHQKLGVIRTLKKNILETSDAVYKIPCKGCDKSYVGETGRQFGVRLKEHRKDSETVKDTKFTKAKRKASTSEQHKSAITDHVAQENHVINWEGASILDKDSNAVSRRIRESIQIPKVGFHILVIRIMLPAAGKNNRCNRTGLGR
ncbi:uncharacterized protein [Amphiura filiformis]|uniref:uncharacterized protein n=1 Tax=Amphiura filiformis TaxID=82378 RepID=UPI003B22886E